MLPPQTTINIPLLRSTEFRNLFSLSYKIAVYLHILQLMMYHPTPIIESSPISKLVSSTVYLKMENVQQTGSFKQRGIGNFCAKAVRERGCKHLISSSGGNAGLAVAYSASKLGVPATIYVPSTTADFMINKIALEGATVIVHGDVWDEAHKQSVERVKQEKESELVHPFDHKEIWEGHATIITESAQQIKKPSAVICVVGGGGLLCGILQGMHQVGWTDVPLFACETLGANSFAESVAHGELITLPAITSIAKTLGARQVTKEALVWNKKHNITPCVVTDKEALDALLAFQFDHQILVEPSCAAGLAILYDKEKKISKVS